MGTYWTRTSDDLWRTTEKVVHMAWQQRGTKRYLYRSVKHQGRVIRQYLGTGPSAEALYHRRGAGAATAAGRG